MANDGFIEFLSGDALSEMDKAIAKLDVMASKVKEVNTAIKGVNTPSGADNSIKAMNASYREQANALKLAKQESDNYYNSIIKANQAKKSDIALSNAQTAATNKATAEANKQALANERLNSAYNRLNSARTEAKNRLRDLIASENASNAALRKAQKEFEVLDQKVRKADRAVGDFSKSVGNYKSALSGVGNLMGAFGIGAGLYLAADIAKNIFQTTKQLQSMDLALKMVSGSQEEFGKNQIFLQILAEQYGIEIKGLTKNFTEFWVASKGKLEAEEIKAIFTSISKSVAVMGLSVEQQDSAFLALQQMMSKGTVQAEELKKQLGNALPGAVKAATMAYQALHPELKVTEKLFMEQMKAGKILSAELLPELAKAYEKLYGIENVKRAETLAASQERLANSWTDLVRAMDAADTSTFWGTQLVGFMNNAKTTLEFLTKILSNVNQINAAAGVKGQATSSEVLTSNPITAELNDNGIKDKEAQKKYLRDQMLSYYKDWEYQVEEFNKLVAEYNSKNAIGKYFAIDLKSEMQSRQKNLEYQKSMYKAYKDYIDALDNPTKKAQKVKEETDAEKKARQKAAKDAAQAEEQRRKDEYNLEVSNIQREIERAKDKFNIVEDLNKKELGYFEGGVAKKMKLSMDLAVLELKLAQKVADEKIRLSKGNKALGVAPTIGGDVIAQNEYATQSVNIAENYTNRMDKINKDYFSSMEEAIPSDWSSKTPTMWSKEQIKQAEEDAEKIKKTQKELQDEFRNYIQSFGQDFFSNAGFGETFDFFLRMDEQGKTMFDKLGELADGSNEKFAATFQAISESAQEMFNFISNASQKNFDAEYERLERQRDVALAFAGDSASAREEIEQQYEQRRKGIARREAKAKQQQAIFNIAIDTAQGIMAAVMKSPLTGGLPWSAIVAAIGAAQIAMVSSQQIPQYWKGTDNAEGGLAWTQEKGREIITDSQGRIKSTGSDGGAQLTMLSKGDKVFTAEKSAMMFNDSLNGILTGNNISMPKIEVSMDAEKITNEIKSLANTIANKPSFTLVKDAKGERIYIRKQAEIKEIQNARLNIKGYDV